MPDDRRLIALERRIADLETQLETLPARAAIVTRGLEKFFGTLTTDLILADGKTCSVQLQQFLGNGTWQNMANQIMTGVGAVARKSGYKIAAGTQVQVIMEPISGLYVVDICYGCYTLLGGS